MEDLQKLLKDNIIDTGKHIYSRSLAVAASGNLSARLDKDNFFITGSGTYLGRLKESDIVKVNINTKEAEGEKAPSSELPLHTLVYKNFDVNTVIHCHPPLINGYFAVNDSLEILTYETRFYLGNIPVVRQDTPTVTKPEQVVEALKVSNIVVLKNHGVIAIANDFSEGLALIETLEEAVKTAAMARIFKQDIHRPVSGEKITGRDTSESGKHPMFSPEHIQKIVDLVNKDDFIAQKGKELDLTVELAIKLAGSDKTYKFKFDKGKIKDLRFDAEAPFVISADADIWRQVFEGNLDPFVAVTQGKMNLDGELGRLSKWYVPFSRLFELFKQVRVK